MKKESQLFNKKDFASNYDKLIKKQEWHGAETMFGMVYKYVRPNEDILDLGIGTGLSGELFHKAGLNVYGLDCSNEMLEVCRKKNIAKELRQFDLNKSPLPYKNQLFNHVSANAVLYFLRDLEILFKEISRVIKKNGAFAFIIEEEKSSENDIVEKPKSKNGLINFRHSRKYIMDLIDKNGFTLLKDLDFTAKNFQMQGKEVVFTLFVCRS